MTDRTQTTTIAIAGTGRIARSLGALLQRGGNAVAAAGGRCPSQTEQAARFIGCRNAVAIPELPRYARRIVIAVTDGAIPEVAAALAAAGLRDGIVLHTSGAQGPEALESLRAAGNAAGVLHPLQTVPTAEQGLESLRGAAYAFAGDPEATALAAKIVALLDGKPLRPNPACWPHYHAGAVLACNYQVTLVDAALELMGMSGIGRDEALAALAPILRATLDNVLASGVERALTGPIRRGDTGTIGRHLGALETSPQTRDLYIAAGLRTIPIALHAGLTASAATEIAAELERAR